MTARPIPKSLKGLSTITGEFIAGLEAQQLALGVTQNTAATLSADLAAAETADAEYQAIRTTRRDLLQPALSKADAEGRIFIRRAKNVLGAHLGDQWSEQWAGAGFVDESVQIPGTLSGRENVLKLLAIYFTRHKTHENKELNVTAARARTLHAALLSARTAVEAHPAAQKAARKKRDEAIEVLRKRLRATLSELDLRLKADSPEWASFGVTAPALRVRRRGKKDAAATEPAVPAPGARAASESASDVALAK